MTLGLVAFGLVMVFSATSASAALGAGDPMTFLVKQGAYAMVGLVLLALASRFDYHRLRALAPVPARRGARRSASPCSPSARPINGARRWFLVGPISVQPSELAKIAVCIWACAVLSPPAGAAHDGRADEAARASSSASSRVLILLEPDLGTTISLCVMVAGHPARLRRADAPLRCSPATFALALGAAAIYDGAVPRERASSASSTRGRTRRARASRPCRRSSGWAPAASPARASARASRRSSTCPRRTPT